MNFRVTVCAALVVALTGCSSSTGVYRWIPFVGNGKKNQSETAIAKVNKSSPFGPITGPLYYGLEMRVKVNPDVIRLSEARSLEVHLQLINRSKNLPNGLTSNRSIRLRDTLLSIPVNERSSLETFRLVIWLPGGPIRLKHW